MSPRSVVDYAPVSSFAWLDHNEDDAQRMREVLASFAESETVDSLGLGVIRDAFAEQLFPGTSTVQTRARYFCFVPWIARELERSGIRPTEFDRALRRHEAQLIRCLRDGTDPQETGVIGRHAGERVKQLPTTIYWSGLGRLGIRRVDISLAQYRQSFRRLAEQARHVPRDDDGEPLTSIRHVWDPQLPSSPDRFLDGPLSLDLEEPEADYLTDRILESCAGSLLAELVRVPALLDDAWAPWEVPVDGLAAPLREVIEHAEVFSHVTHGARLLYNVLLADHAVRYLEHERPDWEDELRGTLDRWGDELRADRARIAQWFDRITEFWTIVERVAEVPTPVRDFVHQWTRRALDAPHTVADDPAAQRLIIDRERSLKGARARLSNRRALESWSGKPRGEERLTYRWGIGSTIARDIAAGWGGT